jgi:hypothetical protein
MSWFGDWNGAPALTTYPPESDVLDGVVYGPDGTLVGTYVPPPSKQPIYIFDD